MTPSRNNRRKLEHLRIVSEDPDADRRRGYFEALLLDHRALPEIDLQTVDTALPFCGRRMRLPLLISSMTGGDADELRRINRNLATAAAACGIGLAVGSQRVMFDNPAARDSFALREHAPDAFLAANLGAVQLNHGFGLAECRQAVEAVGADALCLHLNPLQEAVQPEGNTNFASLADRIGNVATRLGVPVILKEVGAGISPADVRRVLHRGVRIVDVAGSGGTSWSRIEARRAGGDERGLLFQDWGVPTPLAVRRLRAAEPQLRIIASGGIRTGLDMAKAVILGAELCGIARPFLAPARESVEAVIALIDRLAAELRTAMFLLGCRTLRELRDREDLLLFDPWRDGGGQ